MPFSESLAARTRDALAREPGITEKKMFGGLSFLLHGKLLVGVFKDSLIARVGPEQAKTALKKPHVGVFDITGRPMKGWVVVEPEGVDRDADLKTWIRQAIEFVSALDREVIATPHGVPTMPARKTDKASEPAARKPAKRTEAQGEVAATLPEAMTGRASPAKAAVGDKPVFAYIAGLPQPQRGIAESVDALAARTLPGLQRSVKWGMSYYGVGDGWCFCCGGFAGHVKLMFINGAALDPVPPVTPVGMGKSTRGVELQSVDDIDERQIASWMKQVAAVPGVGGKKR
jgi:TfoX/Sxy family transcriptional regulator of competence genes